MNKTTYKSYGELPAVLTACELARVLRISRSGAYNLMSKKDFPSVKVGKRVVTPKDLFIKWLETEATKPQRPRKP